MSRWIIVVLFTLLIFSLAAQQLNSRFFVDDTGQVVEETIVKNIPPELRVPGPVAIPTRSAVMVNDVPTFNWCYGCGPTSAAMLAGYYDRRGYSNIYTGPANGGVVPLTNSVWGVGECPLSATHNGIDGRVTAGHKDRFFISEGSSGNDPFGTGDPTGTYGECTADYMGTSQDWWNAIDGWSIYYTYNNGNQTPNYTYCETEAVRHKDGSYGLKQFFQSRGYVVSECYNQNIYGYGGVNNGFTYANFKSKIDAGIPVIFILPGHIILGVGYDSSSNTVYVHDTWDYLTHTMTWGGTYSGYTMKLVGVVSLAPATISNAPLSFTQSLATNLSASQNLTISNPGIQTLNYTCTVPSGLSVVLDETFATTSLPAGWTQSYVTGTNPWTFEVGGFNGNPAAAYDGSYNARLYWGNSAGTITKLITPSMNLTGGTGATLTFYHTQALWPNDQDELRVYYKISALGTWTLLSTYTNSITAWTQETISLPNLSSTYYIAFEGTAKYGFGVCLDKIVVARQGLAAGWLGLNGGSSYTGSIAVGGAAASIPVNFNTTGLAAGTYTSNITVTSNSWTNSSYTIPVNLTVPSPAPSVPTGVTITRNTSTGNVTIAWNASTGTFTGYHIYSCPNPGFAAGETTLAGTTTSSVRTLVIPAASVTTRKFYKIAAY